jgi:hypothetical protein
MVPSTIVTDASTVASSNPHYDVNLPSLFGSVPALPPILPDEASPFDETASISNIASFIRSCPDLYVNPEFTAALRKGAFVSTKHLQTSKVVQERLFDVIGKHPHLAFLSEHILDPNEGRLRRQLFILCQGAKSQAKMEILNSVLLIFASSLLQKKYRGTDLSSLSTEELAEAQYQPSTLSTMHKQLFADFNREGITIKLSNFKTFHGSFQAYWKGSFLATAQLRPDYGRLPNQAPVDQDEDFKLRNNAKPPWDFTQYNDLICVFVWQLLTTFMLRGCQEVRIFVAVDCCVFEFTDPLFYHFLLFSQPTSLRFTDFDLYVKTHGPNAGKKCLSLKGLSTDKTHKLSLSNNTLRDETGFHDIVENILDKFCPVSLYIEFQRHFPPNWCGTFLRRPVPAKELKKLKPDASGFVSIADLADKGKMGKNYPTQVCQSVAKRIGLENPMKHTASGRRRSGITKLVSSSENVPSSEILLSARHKSALTNAGYQAANEEAHAKRHRAMMYLPPDEEADDRKMPADDSLITHVTKKIPKKKKKRRSKVSFQLVSTLFSLKI